MVQVADSEEDVKWYLGLTHSYVINIDKTRPQKDDQIAWLHKLPSVLFETMQTMETYCKGLSR